MKLTATSRYSTARRRDLTAVTLLLVFISMIGVATLEVIR